MLAAVALEAILGGGLVLTAAGCSGCKVWPRALNYVLLNFYRGRLGAYTLWAELGVATSCVKKSLALHFALSYSQTA